MGARFRRLRRAAQVGRVARRAHVLRVLREVGVVGDRPATTETAREFRLALEELGTTWIKLGQLLSSRPDLLPDVYIEELERLVDDVPPLPAAEIRSVVAADLGPDTFVEFSEEPLATASIAQIHRAILKDGREVVVKVRRPGISEQVALDLEVMRAAAGMAEKRSGTARLLQLGPLAEELESHLRAELDFVEEASNTETIARFVADVDELTVPDVIRPYVTERVLVLERVHGAKVAAGHGLPPERARELAREFFRTYVRQVTVEGIYHADPHRGNVLLTEDGRLALLDFGLLGRLDDDTRRKLALLLIAVAHNRADDVAALLLSLSLTTLDSDQPSFVHDVRRKLPRYHWRPLAEIRAGEALTDLQRVALRHGIRLPTSFALVGKTLSQADTIARTLDPELDPVALLEEDALEVMLAEVERKLEPQRLLSELFIQLEPLLRMPRRLSHVAERLDDGTLKIGVAPTDLRGLDDVLRSAANRIGAALILVGLLVASALIARVYEGLALAGFLLGAAVGLYMVWKIVRTPGELRDTLDTSLQKGKDQAMNSGYAKPVLVTTEWLAEHLGDDGLVVAEVDENPSLYEEGHIPAAVKLHWREDLQDAVERDLVEKAEFERLLAARGIGNNTTVILYGDKNNWFAAYAYWYLKIYGHEDVRILDGGRQKWIDEDRELTTEVPSPAPASYTARERDESIRARRDAVRETIGASGKALVDVRSPQEYSGELIAPPGYEQEGAQRAGHIPTAQSIPWAQAVRDDGTFKSAAELRELYGGKGVTQDSDVTAYCRIGERSAHTWFVLRELLGYESVKNYDGSWTEWGNLVDVPIELGP